MCITRDVEERVLHKSVLEKKVEQLAARHFNLASFLGPVVLLEIFVRSHIYSSGHTFIYGMKNPENVKN